jgi:hypothetical protein
MRDSYCYRQTETEKRIEIIMKTQMKPLLRTLAVLALISASNPASAYYDPGVQRWINRNPIEEVGGLNLYSFCENSCIGWYDPDGCPPTGGDYPVLPPPGSGLPVYIPPGSSAGAAGAGNLVPAYPILPPGFRCEGTMNGAPVISGPVAPPPKKPTPTRPGGTNAPPTRLPPTNAPPVRVPPTNPPPQKPPDTPPLIYHPIT